ncbi:MAG: 1,4-dihydroxy-2-naphthoate polyprenyltransferase [bacterium]
MIDTPLKTWVIASRPKTLPAAMAPVLIGTAIAYESGGFHLLSCLAAVIGALLIQVGTNFANDYYDYKKGADEGERLGPTRVTQSRMVTPSTMKKATYYMFSLALVSGVYLVLRGGWPIVIIGLSSILFGVLYTGGPYPLGYNGLADIFVLIFFGPVAVGGTYYVQTLDINYIILLAGLSPGFFSVAILTVNNLRDIDNDKRVGKKTLAVRFGASYARMQYSVAVIIGILIPLLIVLFISDKYVSLISLLTLIVAVPLIKKVYTVIGRELNNVLASTGQLLLLYSILFSIGWLL